MTSDSAKGRKHEVLLYSVTYASGIVINGMEELAKPEHGWPMGMIERRAVRSKGENCTEFAQNVHHHHHDNYRMDVLKAAGTPITNPLPVNSFDKLILLPGEFSWRTSRSGRRSPTLTEMGREV